MNEGREDNLPNFLAASVESIRDRMDGLVSRIETRFEGMETRIGGALATVDERLAAMDGRFGTIEGRLSTIVERVDAGFAAVRGDVERVHLRIESIEHLLSARLDRVEAELGRLRSVAYLLVKDRPELLRLLGEPPVS
jgi:hypothetical protein